MVNKGTPLLLEIRGNGDQYVCNAAILALGGELRRDLVHGIRVMAKSGSQLVAVYWLDLHPGNEVEIAICDSRVFEKYDIGLVQR